MLEDPASLPPAQELLSTIALIDCKTMAVTTCRERFIVVTKEGVISCCRRWLLLETSIDSLSLIPLAYLCWWSLIWAMFGVFPDWSRIWPFPCLLSCYPSIISSTCPILVLLPTSNYFFYFVS
jgi:hypothetical protein